MTPSAARISTATMPRNGCVLSRSTVDPFKSCCLWMIMPPTYGRNQQPRTRYLLDTFAFYTHTPILFELDIVGTPNSSYLRNGVEALVEVDIVDLIAGIEARDESNDTGELCSKGGFRLDGQTEESGLSKHGFRRMLDDWGRKCHTQAGSHYREGRECGGPKGRCR